MQKLREEIKNQIYSKLCCRIQIIHFQVEFHYLKGDA